MAKVIGGMTLSLDGYVADPQGDISRLYPSLDDLHQSAILQEEIRCTGAVVMGRRSFEMGDPDFYAEHYEYQVPIFVLTHQPPERKPKESKNLTFTFVNAGIDDAIRRAKAAAGERNVMLIGASINQQCLRAGLCDELHCGIMPVLLGGGLRLFEHFSADQVSLEKIRIFETGQRTDVWMRVCR
jgi:dihydrofolate reductase